VPPKFAWMVCKWFASRQATETLLMAVRSSSLRGVALGDAVYSVANHQQGDPHMDDNRSVVERYDAALPADLDTLTSLQHPDFVEDWPQSGERIRGSDNSGRFRSITPRPIGDSPTCRHRRSVDLGIDFHASPHRGGRRHLHRSHKGAVPGRKTSIT
jgi:hypothetical protein